METLSKNRLRFRQDIELEMAYPSKTIIRPLARLEDVLTDESASDIFCSIIRLPTEFILRRVVRLQQIILLDR